MNKIIKIINNRVIEIEEREVGVSVKVQIDIVGSIIQEWIDRIEIERIKKENPVPENDPSIV